MAVVGIVLAAGFGSRFAAADPGAPPKMLAPIEGVPMVRRTVESLLSGGADRCSVVVARSGSEAIGQALEGLSVDLVINPDPSRGMFSSVVCGVTATTESDICVLLPGDMPYISPATIQMVITAGQNGAHTVTPRLDGHRGHPVVCSHTLRTRILAAGPDARLDHLLAQDTVLEVDVSDSGVRRDVDRPPRRV